MKREAAGRYSFTTFEEYVETRWDMSAEQCRRLIEASSAAEKLHQLVEVLPSRESHVRELLKIEEYVETRWDMADRSARQMIESAEAAEKTGTIVPIFVAGAGWRCEDCFKSVYRHWPDRSLLPASFARASIRWSCHP